MSKVRDLMKALEEDGFVNVEFANTGGGCHAIMIPWAIDGDEEGEFLITGEDVFSRSDLDSDENVSDEFYVGYYSERVCEGEEIICTTDVPALIAAINAKAGVR